MAVPADLPPPPVLPPRLITRRSSRLSVSMSLAEGLAPQNIANISNPGPTPNQV